MIRLKLLCALACVTTLGCSSVKSTVLNRTQDDVFFGNSNGNPDGNCAARPFNGVPITLRVPTHLDIAVKETILLRTFGSGDKMLLVRLQTPIRQLSIEAKLVETDKVFTVDVKRPAAGTLDYTMEFGDKTGDLDNTQYFKQIKSHIVDKTVQDADKALQTVLPLLRKATPASAGDTASDLAAQVITETRTVAWKRFDLDTPDFEMEVGCFVEQHLNCCNNCLNNFNNSTFEHTAAEKARLSESQNNPTPDTPPAPVPETGVQPTAARRIREIK